MATASGLPVELRNQLAQQLGYTGEFGSGGFQNWLSQTGLAPQWQTMVQGAQATEQSFLNPADNMWYGVNANGQVEKLMAVQLPTAEGLGELTYVLESELTPEMLAGAISVQQVPGGVNDDNWFDKAMDVAIPGGLAIMSGYAGAGALGGSGFAGGVEGAASTGFGGGAGGLGGVTPGGMDVLAGGGDMFGSGAAWDAGTAAIDPTLAGTIGVEALPPSGLPQSVGSDGSVPPGSPDGGSTGSTGGTGGTGGTVNIPGIGDVPISTIGNVLATVLGVTGNLSASEDYEDLANQILAKHQPFLDQSLTWMQNPNAYFEGPGQAALKANMNALSVHGNPATSPWAVETANTAALKNWQNAVLGFGNVGLGGNNLYSANTGNAINSTTDAASDLAWGVGKVTNPQKPTSMPQLYASLNSGNYL